MISATTHAGFKVWDDARSLLIPRVCWIDEDKLLCATHDFPLVVEGDHVKETQFRVQRISVFAKQHLIVLNARRSFDETMAESLAKLL